MLSAAIRRRSERMISPRVQPASNMQSTTAWIPGSMVASALQPHPAFLPAWMLAPIVLNAGARDGLHRTGNADQFVAHLYIFKTTSLA
jgi:hypothetical protein